MGHLQYNGHQQKIKAIQQSLDEGSSIGPSLTRDSGTGITPDKIAGIDLVKYACACKTHQGKLIIGTSDIWFETITRGKEMWRIPYTRLAKVEKVSS